MKTLKTCSGMTTVGLLLILIAGGPVLADDTCVFTVTADDVPPNIVLLLDNGAEMEQIVWHDSHANPTYRYDNSVDYTPNPASDLDVVSNGLAGNGFFNDRGYGIVKHGSTYYLVPVLDNLELGSYTIGLAADSGNTWSVTLPSSSTRSIALPNEPSTVVDADGIKDNAVYFRYSKNYLNWLFFSNLYLKADGILHGDGSDLPTQSRFYYAKKAILTVAKLASNKASFGIYNFANDEGGSNVQPLGMVVDTVDPSSAANNVLDPNFVNNVNNMQTVTYSPLAEGLATIGGYYASPASGVVGFYCQKNFVIVVSPGVSSMDITEANQYVPDTLSDFDADDGGGAIGEGNIKKDATTYTIPTNIDGSSWLDDVAYYMNSNDIVDYRVGFQNIYTYTVGFMGDLESNLFLKNVSNNGNGNVNLYDSSDPKYGKFHFEAQNPNQLSTVLLNALNDILSRTNSYTAPVVPVTRTTSGNRIYMAFFTPTNDSNFWAGNVVKFGISDDNRIVDVSGNDATWSNGSIKDDADPYWATKDWADPAKSNYMDNTARNIYTYLGISASLSHATNDFDASNTDLTAALLGSPTHSEAFIINYVRGADVFDVNNNADITENRSTITGDVLHSEPLVVRYSDSVSMVYYGSNDGMLHAVSDADGTEAWAFIPPDQLPRLKDMVEGVGHQYYVDSSPKAYIKDVNGDGVIAIGTDQVVVICGERKGGHSYFGLDVTNPAAPRFLWRINNYDDAAAGLAPGSAPPNVIIPGLGESWPEPQIGVVKTSAGDTTGTPVFFIGGGYSSDNSLGKSVLAVNVLTGALVWQSIAVTGMDYSFASSVNAVDADLNGFVDKVYVGDVGGQMWRFGKFTDGAGVALTFPDCNENINSWVAQTVFVADALHVRKFFFPPRVALEKGYDLVFGGTGNREDPCNRTGSDRIYAFKDAHEAVELAEVNLVDVTDTAAAMPDLEDPASDVDSNGSPDQGWYIRLAESEKVLAEGTVFYKVFYITTFLPNDDPCLPGGMGKIYALGYKTGEALLPAGAGVKSRSFEIGGGIPSKPVMVITEKRQKMFISVGSTIPSALNEPLSAGIVAIDPLAPPRNFFYLWWRELTS